MSVRRPPGHSHHAHRGRQQGAHGRHGQGGPGREQQLLATSPIPLTCPLAGQHSQARVVGGGEAGAGRGAHQCVRRRGILRRGPQEADHGGPERACRQW